MPRFAGIPVEPEQQSAKRPRFAGVPVGDIQDMEPVTSRPGMGEEYWQEEREKLAARDPLEGESNTSRFLAGLYKSGLDTVRGVKQGAVDSVNRSAAAATLGLDALGLDGARDMVARNIGAPVARKSAELQRETATNRRFEAPITDSAAGLAGNVVGAVGQIVGPGLALRGSLAGQALLPTTARGNALQGLAYGASQPALSEQERAKQGVIGLGAGFTGVAAPRLLGQAVSGVRNSMPTVTRAGQERAAAKVLNTFADDPNAVLQGARSAQVLVPGSMPTLAEATGDVGLAGLQRTLANAPEFANPLTLRREANNAARVRAIEEGFGGANAAAADSLTRTRDLAARQTLRPIGSVSVSDTAPISTAVARLIEKNKASGTISGVLQDVQAMIPNIKTVQDAHMVRKELAELMGGRIEGKANGKLAQRELMVVRDILDRQMRQAFPDWGKFLREYKGASREIGQVNVGEMLLDKGPNMRAIGEIPQLSPAKFAGAADDMDRTVQQATGFRKARAATALTPQQLQVVDQVRRDLERYARTESRGKAIGSNTMQNIIGGNRLQDAAGPVGAAIVEPISGVAMLGLNQMRKAYGARVAGLVEEAMLDPARAAEILATVPPDQRAEVVRAAAALIGPRLGVVAPTLAD